MSNLEFVKSGKKSALILIDFQPQMTLELQVIETKH